MHAGGCSNSWGNTKAEEITRCALRIYGMRAPAIWRVADWTEVLFLALFLTLPTATPGGHYYIDLTLERNRMPVMSLGVESNQITASTPPGTVNVLSSHIMPRSFKYAL